MRKLIEFKTFDGLFFVKRRRKKDVDREKYFEYSSKIDMCNPPRGWSYDFPLNPTPIFGRLLK